MQVVWQMLVSGPGSLFSAAAALLVGLVVGGFLNVVIYRLPRMMEREAEEFRAELNGAVLDHPPYNLVAPASVCAHCGHALRIWEKIPVASYLALRGRCNACAHFIGRRYLAIEIATGLLSAMVIWTVGSGAAGAAALVLLYCLIVLTAIDLDTFLVPDDITLPLVWLGLFVNLTATFAPVADAVVGAMFGYGLLWGSNMLYRWLRGGDGIGYGDFKLLAALGAWMGWTAVPGILGGAIAAAGLVGLSMRVLGGQSDARLPFGPYLAGAGLLVLLYGQPIKAMLEKL
jgi:leader peptidase (prepilin peptidase)/N-methyltransferase